MARDRGTEQSHPQGPRFKFPVGSIFPNSLTAEQRSEKSRKAGMAYSVKAAALRADNQARHDASIARAAALGLVYDPTSSAYKRRAQ